MGDNEIRLANSVCRSSNSFTFLDVLVSLWFAWWESTTFLLTKHQTIPHLYSDGRLLLAIARGVVLLAAVLSRGVALLAVASVCVNQCIASLWEGIVFCPGTEYTFVSSTRVGLSVLS